MSLRPMTSVAQALQSENSLRDSVKTIEKAVQKRWFRTRSPYHELRKVWVGMPQIESQQIESHLFAQR